jgi:ubiquinone/menaquinone biosynthesis C-methylase UbiE
MARTSDRDPSASLQPRHPGRRGPRDLISAIGGSLGFDHAVAYYDETRGLSPEVQRATARMLDAELAGSNVVLEIGAGTGQVAVPLAQEGMPVIGLDLSPGMLHQLSTRASQVGVHVPILVGDAIALPFADDQFDGVVMRHVLHLVAGWRQALLEVVRVLRPNGRFAVSLTDYTGLYHTLQERFLRASGDLPIAIGLRPDNSASLEEAMREVGGIAGDPLIVRGRRTLTIDAFLRNMERRVYTWTWAADNRTCKRAVGEVRRWAHAELGDLRRPVEPEFEIEWRVFRFTG